jgi:hypothetical protein
MKKSDLKINVHFKNIENCIDKIMSENEFFTH